MLYNVWINNSKPDLRGHVYPHGLAREKGGKPFVFATIAAADAWIEAHGYENTTDATRRRSAYACEDITRRPAVPVLA